MINIIQVIIKITKDLKKINPMRIKVIIKTKITVTQIIRVLKTLMSKANSTKLINKNRHRPLKI